MGIAHDLAGMWFFKLRKVNQALLYSSNPFLYILLVFFRKEVSPAFISAKQSVRSSRFRRVGAPAKQKLTRAAQVLELRSANRRRTTD
jgi:hypothetical protein